MKAMLIAFSRAVQNELRKYRIEKLEKLQNKMVAERDRLKKKALAYQAEREKLEQA